MLLLIIKHIAKGGENLVFFSIPSGIHNRVPKCNENIHIFSVLDSSMQCFLGNM